MNRNSPIIIIEDDPDDQELLQEAFKSLPYPNELYFFLNGQAALDFLNGSEIIPFLILSDINLPKLDGMALLQQVRPTMPKLPILVLTGRNQLEDRVMALDGGADDCMVKPFSFHELAARTRALMRRSGAGTGCLLQVGDLVLDREQFRVERSGKRIDLTAKEFSVLECLMLNARRSVTRAMLMEYVWKAPYDASTNLVDVYVKYVRDKVDTGFPVKLMRTIRGVGYVIAEN